MYSEDQQKLNGVLRAVLYNGRCQSNGNMTTGSAPAYLWIVSFLVCQFREAALHRARQHSDRLQTGQSES